VRQIDSAHAIDVYNHYFELVANADNRLNVWNSVLGKFTDVNHSILARKNLNKCPKWHDSNNSACVLVADLNVLSKSGNCGLRLVSVFAIRRSNNNCAVVLNVDSYTELVDHSTNYRSTRTDDCADLVGRNLERKHSRCVLAEVVSGYRDC
jgi:hypothetical protein